MPNVEITTKHGNKVQILNSKAAKAARNAAKKAIEEARKAVPPPKPNNNKTRKNKIQQIKNAVARRIALANFSRKNKHPPNVPESNRASKSNPNHVLIPVKEESASNSRTPTPSGWCTSCRRKKRKNGASRRRNRS